MDDSGHDLKASAGQDFYAHDLPYGKQTDYEKKESESPLPWPRPDPLQRIGKNADKVLQPLSSCKDTSEELLVARAEQGDDEAFGILSERYTEPIRRYIRTLVENDETASELTQETLFKAWLSLPTRDQKRTLNFRPWLYRIAYTTTMDEFRKHPLANRTIPMEGKNEKASRQSSWVERVENSLCKRESILTALNQVYPQYRQCMIMRYIDFLSFQEISKALDISEVTVRANISRGRQQFIRAYLREMGNDADRDDTTREEGK